MRIVGGIHRGRTIKAPAGREATRPTTDRVREAIASMVIARTGALDGRSVLDAFAGSGALGIEMLSRGASHATLCDQDQHALACIRGNLASLGIGSQAARVVRCDACAAAARGHVPGAPFAVVLLDPPYAMPATQVGQLVADLARRGMLAAGCVVMYERSADAPGLALPDLEPLSSRTYGSTAVDVLRLCDAPDADATDTI